MLASQRSKQSQEDTPMNEAPHYQESTENKALAAATMGEGTRTEATGKLGHLDVTFSTQQAIPRGQATHR